MGGSWRRLEEGGLEGGGGVQVSVGLGVVTWHNLPLSTLKGFVSFLSNKETIVSFLLRFVFVGEDDYLLFSAVSLLHFAR